MTGHSSVVGGSTAGLRLCCNASRIEEQKNVRSSSIYADRGTALHHVMEQAITGDLTFKEVLDQFMGVAIKLDGMEHTIDLTAELLTAKVLPALAYLDEVVPRSATMHVERKISMQHHARARGGDSDFEDVPGAFGIGDVLFSDGYRAGVIDWKFGDGIIVSADDNDQGRFYLAAAIMSGDLPVMLDYEFHIFQPAESRDPSEYGSMAIYTLDDLVRFSRDLADAINGPIVYNPGPHCAKCKGKLTCKAYQAMITTAVATDVAGLSARQLAEMLKLVPALQAFAKDVQWVALRNAQLGVEIPGYVLEPSQGNSAWRNEDAAWKALGRMGLSADVRTVKKAISPTQAVKQLKEIGTEAKQLDRFAKTHIFRPDNGERLVEAKAGVEVKGAVKRLAEALVARGH